MTITPYIARRIATNFRKAGAEKYGFEGNHEPNTYAMTGIILGVRGAWSGIPDNFWADWHADKRKMMAKGWRTVKDKTAGWIVLHCIPLSDLKPKKKA